MALLHVLPSIPTHTETDPSGALGVGTTIVPVTAIQLPYEDEGRRK